MNRSTGLNVVLTTVVLLSALFMSGCCSEDDRCRYDHGHNCGPHQMLGEVTLYQTGREPVTWNEAPSEPHAFVVKNNLPRGFVITSINAGTRRYETRLATGDEMVIDPSCDGSYGNVEISANIADESGAYVGFARTMRYVEDSRWYGGWGTRYASRGVRRPQMWVIDNFEIPRQK